MRVLERTKQLAETNEALEAEAAERERTALALVDSEERYRLLVDGSPDMVLVHRDGIIVYLNPPGAELLGLADPAEAIGRPVRELWRVASPEFDSVDIDNALATGELEGPMPVILCRRDGGFVDVELSVALLDSARAAVQCVVRDVTERVHAQRTIERMAFYDTLTDLPNRALFNDRLSSALAQARRRKRDWSRSSSSTSTTSRPSTTRWAMRSATACSGRSRTGCARCARRGHRSRAKAATSSRSSRGSPTATEPRTLAERILESLEDSLVVDGYELHVSASVGIAVYPLDGLEDIELLRNADTAMYRAKELGSQRLPPLHVPRCPSPRSTASNSRPPCARASTSTVRAVLPAAGRRARPARTVGVEALIRWHHPVQRTARRPATFIELAEQAGFMGEIGHWILRTACEQAAQWHAAGHDFGRICVNLSAREFVQQDVVDNVRAALEAARPRRPRCSSSRSPRASRCTTSSTFSRRSASSADIGVRVAIDDFGTGYSSMSYLKRFPITTLKIAQDFMRDVHVNSHSAAIAGMVIDLCHELDLDIVAEGVEYEEQLDFLKSRGCHVIQGFLFSPPVPEEELIEA